MTDKELKRLSRTDLLNMMLNLSKENEALRRRLAEAEEKLGAIREEFTKILGI